MRIEKPLKDFSTFPTWFVSLTSPRVFIKLVSYLRTVSKDFFAIQFLRKFKFIRTPIVHVDNPLDDKVPFNTRCIADYLGFVNYWIRPLGLLITTLGRKKSIPRLEEFYRCIRNAYKNAADIYRFRFSTTNRPHYKRRIYFAGVHMLDPHYLCVPSLHITIVCLAYSFMRKVFDDESYDSKLKEMWNKELYDGAVNIAETVLYVKQHSVNCIPAALYLTAKLFPGLFSEGDALGFLDSMFKNRTDILPDDRREIIQYMKGLFIQFQQESKDCQDWKEPVKKWLINYEKRADNSKYGRPE